MIRHFTFLALAASFGFSAGPAIAQDTSLSPALENTAARNEQVRQLPIRVNMNMQEDKENILLLDLSTGERVAIRRFIITGRR